MDIIEYVLEWVLGYYIISKVLEYIFLNLAYLDSVFLRASMLAHFISVLIITNYFTRGELRLFT